MLGSLKDLERYTLTATDGDSGHIVNVLFDDEHWTVRYLVVDTNHAHAGGPVLIRPVSFRQVDRSSRHFHVALTREEVRNSPSIDADKPVDRQHELAHYRSYGYPFYWGTSGLWGMGPYPDLMAMTAWKELREDYFDDRFCDIHLRSAKEVRGYHVQGSDGELGHVDDFIADDSSWRIRYVRLDTSNWGFGKKVLVAPRWVTRISWDDRKVYVGLSRQAIHDSPLWNPRAGMASPDQAQQAEQGGHTFAEAGNRQREEGDPHPSGPSGR